MGIYYLLIKAKMGLNSVCVCEREERERMIFSGLGLKVKNCFHFEERQEDMKE